MDVPWDGVREGCAACFLCSSTCAVAFLKRLYVQMGNSELVTDYNCKRGIHTGMRGAVLPLVKRVCVANGCPHVQVAAYFGCNGKSGLFCLLAFSVQ